MSNIYRAFINQPSTLQGHHDLHGKYGIVEDNGEPNTVRIYFTDGDVHSMMISRLCFDRVKLSSAED